MDAKSKLFFFSSGFRSAKLMKFKALKLENPVSVGDIKDILEKNINRPYLDIRKPIVSCKVMIRNFRPPIAKPVKVKSQRHHFYPKFNEEVSKSPVIFRELKPKSLSPRIRLLQYREKGKRVKNKSKLNAPQLLVNFDYSKDLKLDDSESSSGSSLSEFRRSIYK